MIKINTKTNQKMLQNFDSEQFPDLTILTSNGKLHLVLAYLSIDSGFFDSLTESQIDLSYLPENSLVRVLRSLYGDELTAYSVQDLEELFIIIQQLKIQDYKDSIVEEIKHNQQLLESLEIVEFCFKNTIMVEEIKHFHFKSRLRALADNRNYLSLNKISIHTLLVLLLQFYEEFGEKSHEIINGILENYFNRNNIRAINFFQLQDADMLQNIWQKYHHSLPIDKMTKQKRALSLENDFQSTMKVLPTSMAKSASQQPIIQSKNKKILELRFQIEEKDKIIKKLRKQLCQLKTPTSSRKTIQAPNLPSLTDEHDDSQMSILEGVRNSKKQKNLIESGNLDLSLVEQETAFHKMSQSKESKSANKVSTQRMHR